jgi:hypothetical protein
MLLNPLAVEVVEEMWIGGVEENPLNGHLSPVSMVSIRNSTMLQERLWPATGKPPFCFPETAYSWRKHVIYSP